MKVRTLGATLPSLASRHRATEPRDARFTLQDTLAANTLTRSGAALPSMAPYVTFTIASYNEEPGDRPSAIFSFK
jgi:hypothetical protein